MHKSGRSWMGQVTNGASSLPRVSCSVPRAMSAIKTDFGQTWSAAQMKNGLVASSTKATNCERHLQLLRKPGCGVNVIPQCCCCTSRDSLRVQFFVAFNHQRLAPEERVTIRSISVSHSHGQASLLKRKKGRIHDRPGEGIAPSAMPSPLFVPA